MKLKFDEMREPRKTTMKAKYFASKRDKRTKRRPQDCSIVDQRQSVEVKFQTNYFSTDRLTLIVLTIRSPSPNLHLKGLQWLLTSHLLLRHFALPLLLRLELYVSFAHGLLAILANVVDCNAAGLIPEGHAGVHVDIKAGAELHPYPGWEVVVYGLDIVTASVDEVDSGTHLVSRLATIRQMDRREVGVVDVRDGS